MRTPLYAPMLSLVALCTFEPQAHGYELYNEGDGTTVLNADLWAGLAGSAARRITSQTRRRSPAGCAGRKASPNMA